jgi:hypothetical protein
MRAAAAAGQLRAAARRGWRRRPVNGWRRRSAARTRTAGPPPTPAARAGSASTCGRPRWPRAGGAQPPAWAARRQSPWPCSWGEQEAVGRRGGGAGKPSCSASAPAPHLSAPAAAAAALAAAASPGSSSQPRQQQRPAPAAAAAGPGSPPRVLLGGGRHLPLEQPDALRGVHAHRGDLALHDQRHQRHAALAQRLLLPLGRAQRAVHERPAARQHQRPHLAAHLDQRHHAPGRQLQLRAGAGAGAVRGGAAEGGVAGRRGPGPTRSKARLRVRPVPRLGNCSSSNSSSSSGALPGAQCVAPAHPAPPAPPPLAPTCSLLSASSRLLDLRSTCCLE